jgi:hypothetical protein
MSYGVDLVVALGIMLVSLALGTVAAIIVDTSLCGWGAAILFVTALAIFAEVGA